MRNIQGYSDMNGGFDEYLPQDTIFGKLRMIDVADFYDRPVSFICQNETGQRYLVVLEDSDEQREMWLYAAITEQTYAQLMTNAIDMQTAFLLPHYVTMVTTLFSNQQSISYTFSSATLTDEYLPAKGEFYYGQD